MKDRVLLVGSYPPPYGGCSVHVMRLREALRENFNVEVIDLYGSGARRDDRAIVRCGRRKPFNALRAVLALLRRPAPLVHFHVAGMDAFLYAAYPMLAALRRETGKLITIHSGSFVAGFEQGPVWRRMLLQHMLRHFDRIVTVNQDQRKFLIRIGVQPERILVIPAFLPPVARESSRARRALQSLAGCHRIVVSSGYGLTYYGFEFIVEALELLQAERDHWGLLLCMYNTFDETYVTKLERSFSSGVSGVIIRDLAPEEFAWVLERCDIYVRATDRDGDAVAVREAQFYGKMVIASDCIPRPAEVRLFKTNDSCSLAQALRDTDEMRSTASTVDERDGLTALLDIYQEILTA